MTTSPFSVAVEARWADLDANRHVRNTAYSEWATHSRFSFLIALGFPHERFIAVGFGPVIFREETRYLREVVLGDRLRVTVELAGESPDFSHFILAHDFLRGAETVAHLEVEGAWMSLGSRRLIVPPDDLRETFHHLPRSARYATLPTVIKSRGGS